MKIAIMQPYFFPYMGYFQLMNAVDEFVVYDNLEYTKKGWINRNRLLVNGRDSYITIPLEKGSDYLQIRDRRLAQSWPAERKKMLNKIMESYRKAPNFASAYPVIESSILFEDGNLFNFILNSLSRVKEYLGIQTALMKSSSIAIDHGLKSVDKIIEVCKVRNADSYFNPIGGVELYKKNDFKQEGIDLFFLKTTNFEYKQFDKTFLPFLSIIDVMMFNSREKVREYLNSCYEII